MTTPRPTIVGIDLPAASLAGDTFTLALPFPTGDQAKALSPNGRKHWRAVAKHKKAQKQAAMVYTAKAIGPLHVPWESASVTYRFFWPDLRPRDIDNYRAMFKGALDGIVRAGLIADDNWKTLRPGENPVSELDRAIPRVEIVIKQLNEGKVA